MTAEPLKPCPCCGSTSRFYHETDGLGRVICDNVDCGLKTQLTIEPFAIQKWNRRVVEPFGNSEELPEWMREVIEMRKQHLIPHLINPYVKNTFERGFHSALNWVLSLKKPEKE